MLFHCPKLSPLQSRFAASCAALVFLGLIYWSLADSHVAYAAELDIIRLSGVGDGQDHNWHRIQEERLREDGIEVDDEYEDGVHVMRRADAAATAISANNAPNNLNIEAGNTTVWMYSSSLLEANYTATGPGLPSEIEKRQHVGVSHAELRKRASSRTIYVSINTCLQPAWNGSEVQTVAPPQLTLYVATSASNTSPGPSQGNDSQVAVELQEGFANVSVTADGDWYMAVSAPALPSGFAGTWNYELAVSIDGYYHAADQDLPFLYQVDTDASAALLVTGNLTQDGPGTKVYEAWMNETAPFTVFAANVDHTSTMGMMSSYCGWKNVAQIAGSTSDPDGSTTNVQMSMITRGLGKLPKEQFYIQSLNGSSNYNGVLAMDGNSTASGAGVVGGGGKIWAPVYWTTKSDGNCGLLFNLSFCDEVAYAVPSNPNNYNTQQLAELFDNYTSFSYQQFNYSLQQIPCNTTADAQYSLVKGCDDCAAAYKEWLCVVSIPRCEDFTNSADYLQPRSMGYKFYNNDSFLSPEILNASYHPMEGAPTIQGSQAFMQTYYSSLATRTSRNPAIIDDLIQPGPYKEVLPCEDLCWGLVQSCPASLGFGCPYSGRGLETAYGKRTSNLTCNYLGAVYDTSGARDAFVPVFKALTIAGLVGVLLGVA